MADRGWINKATLQGYADEVRRLTETTDTGTPGEMLELLRAFEGGSVTIKTGTVKATGTSTMNLGTTFTERDYYFLMGTRGYENASIAPDQYVLMIAEIQVLNGKTTAKAYNYGGSSATAVKLNQSTGVITSTSAGYYGFNSGLRYHWLYVGGKLA